MENPIILTEKAANRISYLSQKEGKEGLMLRLTVLGGGCSGFQYQFSFDDSLQNQDYVFERNGMKLITDQASFDLLKGSTVDYVEELIGSSFKVSNPNAESGCGCGTSFSIGGEVF